MTVNKKHPDAAVKNRLQQWIFVSGFFSCGSCLKRIDWCYPEIGRYRPYVPGLTSLSGIPVGTEETPKNVMDFFNSRSTYASTRRRLALCIIAIVLPVAAIAGGSNVASIKEPTQTSLHLYITAEKWKEACELFQSDPFWLGGDGASSVDLGNGRLLWLFGDSFIDPSGSGDRKKAGLVRNSIGIQNGYDPADAEMAFFWKTKKNAPADFFSSNAGDWFWPASGILIQNRLLVFLMQIEKADNAFGFNVKGWKAVLIDHTQKHPEHWNFNRLAGPQKKGIVVGSGNPIMDNGFLHVFATDPISRMVYLVRWPEHDAFTGNLLKPQWWTGETMGWVEPNRDDIVPYPLLENGRMEFSVQFVPAANRFLLIQTLDLENPCLAALSAKKITGPWSKAECFYAPPERNRREGLIYAGKSHPAIHGAEMAFSYVVNTTRRERLLNDMTIYFPVILKGWTKAEGRP
ncbi:MAG: DUF4185 domain-containing protein [Desulfobacterales bacterium]